MKIDLSYLVLLAALCPAANGWSLYADGKTIERKRPADGGGVKCGKLPLKEGDNISWYKEFQVPCDFKLFAESDCSDYVGKATDNWKHKLTQDVGSYSCLCGPERFED